MDVSKGASHPDIWLESLRHTVYKIAPFRITLNDFR